MGRARSLARRGATPRRPRCVNARRLFARWSLRRAHSSMRIPPATRRQWIASAGSGARWSRRGSSAKGNLSASHARRLPIQLRFTQRRTSGVQGPLAPTGVQGVSPCPSLPLLLGGVQGPLAPTGVQGVSPCPSLPLLLEELRCTHTKQPRCRTTRSAAGSHFGAPLFVNPATSQRQMDEVRASPNERAAQDEPGGVQLEAQQDEQGYDGYPNRERVYERGLA